MSGASQDHRMEMALGMGLRIGVLLASTITLAGGVWLLWSARPSIAAYRHFSADEGRAIFSTLFHHGPASPQTLIALGLLVLIATPVLRVAAMVVGFVLEKDWLYTSVSLLVLAVLAVAMLL